jgi:hypothetical protein
MFLKSLEGLQLSGETTPEWARPMEVLMTREVTVQSHAAPIANLLAFALGAAAVGAIAIGVFAIGRLAIDRVVIKRARFGKLEVDELKVRNLQVLENSGSTR